MLRKILNAGAYPANINIALLILRVAAGAFMLTHGMQKMSLLFGDGPVQFADPIGLGEKTTLILAVISEVLCSVFLILGFASRISAFFLIATMTVAVLIIHQGDEFKSIELALLYLSAFLAILFTGAGKYSIDNALVKN